MRTSTISLLFILFLGTNVLAKKDSSQTKISGNNYIRIAYENDYFTQTDYYYTQGIRLESFNPVFRYSPVMWLLPHLKHSSIQYGLAVAQDCFTPTNIGTDSILKGDRPYAGYIYLGHYKTSADYYKKQLLTAELDIGAIGSCAECKQEQEAIHHWTNNIQPGGWQYQIGNGILLNYRLRYEKAFYSDTAIDIDATGEINAGTVYDNALAGITLHLGKMQSYFLLNHYPGFQLYGIVKVWMEGVAYNGTLQGDLFTNNSIYMISSAQISPVVVGDSYGICLSWHRVSVVYSVTHITNEFASGNYHGWGHLDFTWYF